MTAHWKKTFIVGVLAVVALVLMAKLAYTAYEKREVLSYAWNNSEKVSWLLEADKQVQADGNLKIKSAVATLFISGN